DGLNDPFNRRPLSLTNEALQIFYRQISDIRNKSVILKTGAYSFCAANEDLILILRFVLNGKDMFDAESENGVYLTVVNRAAHSGYFALDLLDQKECVDTVRMEALQNMELTSAKCLLTGKKFFAGKGIVSGEIPPVSCAVIKIE
ncbi:MAG: hypothetical protein WCP73_07025, partial [Eubacteriales bacterium]